MLVTHVTVMVITLHDTKKNIKSFKKNNVITI